MNLPRLASIDVDGWMIDDGEVAHAAAPETYSIPSLADRLSIGPGDLAKIRFYIRVAEEDGQVFDHGERMWVQVTGRLDGWYRGELDNQPCCTDDIAPGLEVWFQARHVISILRSDESAKDSRVVG
ncbi:hypothetical protein [Dyella japonica]|jgi:hypothetical protein|uniref:DUF2314 domain-containing protein n=1 Tax=Dyella japonica DSM 16301 TaxID=1440762 RepID=A0A0G9H349_9GAMM|nr:hypothetical protein [Dyella japonica]KLD63931.1 hypothetical protein Y882_09995 [Dyella japonica DSM 16301]